MCVAHAMLTFVLLYLASHAGGLKGLKTFSLSKFLRSPYRRVTHVTEVTVEPPFSQKFYPLTINKRIPLLRIRTLYYYI